MTKTEPRAEIEESARINGELLQARPVLAYGLRYFHDALAADGRVLKAAEDLHQTASEICMLVFASDTRS